MNILSHFPRASRDFLALNENNQTHDQIQPAKPQPPSTDALGGKATGKNQSRSRVKVCFRIYRCKLQDIDNCYGGIKPTVDSLILAGLIQDDNPEAISLTVEQEKVSTRAEQRIELTLVYP